MISRYSHDGIVWVDLETPTREEVLSVAEEFGLNDIVTEEMMLPSTKPRIEQHGG